jgi:hypothetical protein
VRSATHWPSRRARPAGPGAIKVAGPPGGDQSNDGSYEKLAEARMDGLDDHSDLTFLVPTVDRLSQYRIAAAAIPPELRNTVRSTEAGRLLWQSTKDVRERHTLIESLKNNKGVVTIDAVREHFERRPTREAPPPKKVADAKLRRKKTPEEKATEEQIRESKKAAVIAAGEGRHVSAYLWKMVTKIDEWRRDMAVMREELGDLAEDEKIRVAETTRRLRDECDAWLDVLEGREPEPDVLEGRVLETAELTA